MSRRPALRTVLRAALAAALFGLLAATLSACLPKNKDWTHPRMADPRKEDQLFISDQAFCEGKIGADAKGPEREAAMDQCLTRLGWKRKD